MSRKSLRPVSSLRERRRLFMEPLEARSLMAIDLGITLTVTDQANGTTLPGNELANGLDLNLGEDFLLVANVEDLRAAPTDVGVLQAYLDLNFPTFAGTPGLVSFNPIFTSGVQTGTAAAGALTEIGAGGNSTTTDPTWLFVIPFTAETAGVLNFTATLDTATGSVLRLADDVLPDEFTITNDSVTVLPELDVITDPAAVDEDSAAFNVAVTGIDGGVGATEQLTASSGNTSLVTTSVVYTPGDATGTVVVTPVPDAFGTTTITVSATVNGAVRTRTFNVTVNPLNDNPVFTLSAEPVTYVEDAAAEVIAQTATLTDVDSPDFDTGTLTVSITNNGEISDLLAIRNQGTLAGEIGTSGADVTFGGITIGTFAGGNGVPLVITFNANASMAAVEALLSNITFQSSSQTPSILTRTVSFSLTDGDGGTASQTKTVDVVEINDDPILTLSTEVVTAVEQLGPVLIAPTSTLVDIDSTNYDTGMLIVAVTNSEGNETITIRNQGNAAGEIGVNGNDVTFGGTTIGTFTGGAAQPLEITFNASATIAAVEALLRNLQVEITGDATSATAREMNFILTDGAGGNAVDTKMVAVTAINDAPQLTLSGGPATFIENGTDQLIAPTSTLLDTDQGDFASGTLTIDYTANGSADDRLELIEEGTGAGQIGLAGNNVTFGGTIFATVSGGVGTTPLVFTFNTNADQAAVEALIRRISFGNISDTPSVLPRTVRFTLVDGDGTANSGQDSVSATTTVNVVAVNDAPVVTLSTEAVSYTENAAAVILTSGATLTSSDSTDFDTGTLTVSISANSSPTDVLEIRNQGIAANEIGVSGTDVTFGGTTIGSFTGGTGGNALVVTFNASATTAAVETLLKNITFRNSSNNPGSAQRTIQFALNDGDGTTNGGVAVDTDTKNVTVIPVNNAPNLTLAATALAYNENAAATIIDATATVTDDDSADFDTGTLTVAFQTGGTADDRLAIRNEGTAANQIGVSGTNVTFGGTTIGSFSGGSGTTPLVITFNGAATVAAVEALVKNITYANVSENPATAARTVRFTLVDGDGTANSGQDTDTADKTINVTAINDAPVVTLSGGAATFTENGGVIILDAGITVTDADSTDFDTGSLTVSLNANGTADDRLAVRNEGTATNQIGVNASNITFGGTTIGTFTGGDGTTPLVITFNASATPAAVQALMRNITFNNVSENPSSLQRTVRFVLNDGDGTANGGANSDTDDKLVTIAAVNDAPVHTLSTETVTYTDGQGAVIISATGTVDDVDSTDFNGGKLTIALTTAGTSDDRLEIRNQGTAAGQIGVSGSNVTFGGTTIGTFTGGTGTTALEITFNNSATKEAVQALSRNITFNNVSATPSTVNRVATFTLTDGDGGTDTDTKTLSVVDANRAPTVTLSTETVNFVENSASGVAIVATATITDGDSTNFNTGTLTISITANGSVDDRLTIRNQGTAANQIGVSGANITFGGTVIGTFAGGVGTTPLTVTLNASATSAAVKALVENVLFSNVSDTPTTDARTLSVTLRDTAAATGQTSADVTKSVSVTAANDAPVHTMPGTAGTGINQNIVFSTANGNRISIADADVGTGALSIVLSSANGTLSLSGITGLTFTAGTGTNDTLMTFTGTLANVNAALEGLTFKPNTGFAGTAFITMTTSDQGNTGGAALSDADTITIGVGNKMSGAVYIDSNSNGVKNTGEIGIPNVTVTLVGLDTDNASITRTATTDANGNFSFSALPGGRFRIAQTVNDNFLFAGSSVVDVATVAGQDTTGLSFGSRGIRPELITINHFLASTPAASTLISSLAPATGQAIRLATVASSRTNSATTTAVASNIATTTGTATITPSSVVSSLSSSRLARRTTAVAVPAVTTPALSVPAVVPAANSSATSVRRTITRTQAQRIVQAAASQWIAAAPPAVAAEVAAKLTDINVQVVDLPGDQMAFAQAGLISFDIDAAGQGWFVDPTPDQNEEFFQELGRLTHMDAAEADRIDLLTVAAHELGHLLGLDDLSESAAEALMEESLLPGVRKEIDLTALETLFGQH